MSIRKLSIIFLTLIFLFPPSAWALYQPWIAEQAARKAYQQKFATYSPESQKKLTNLTNLMVEINKNRSSELTANLNSQALILDEYQKRLNNQTNTKIEKARYWLTYAHEAVAFQEAKNYIFTLTQEKNLRSDVTPTVGQLKADLEATRKKVINSQVVLEQTINQ